MNLNHIPSLLVRGFSILLVLGAAWHQTAAQENVTDYDETKRIPITYPSAITFDVLQSNLFAFINTTTPSLLKNVFGNYPRSVPASPFLIWAPTGFPIALGSSNNFPLPVVVAVELPSTSRVVAFGHEGIPGGCCTSNDDWDKLTLNAVRWIASKRTALRMATPVAVWAQSTLPNIQREIRSLVITTIQMDLDNFARGGWEYVDLYWIDTYAEYTPTQVSALLNFVNQPRKGLVVAGHTWYWGYSNPGANILTESSINKVLWPLGLAITPDSQTGFQPAPFRPPTSITPFYNARYVISLLAQIKARGATPMPKGFYPTSDGIIKQLMQWLPPRSAIDSAVGLNELWSLVDVGRMSNSPAASVTVPLDPQIGPPSKLLDAYVDSYSNRYSDVTALRVSRSAKAFPGSLSLSTPRISTMITIDGNYGQQAQKIPYAQWDEPVWRSTGLYAPPGQLVAVTLAKTSVAGEGLLVQVGAHKDDLLLEEVWKRVPIAISRFELNDIVTVVGNSLGGLLYVLVPPGSSLGDVQISFSNVVQAPYFRMGTTDRVTWNRTIRLFPAPWVELDSGKLIITLPVVAIRSLSDPTPLMRYWNQVMDLIAAFTSINQRRIRQERLVLDADIAGGWIHAGYPVTLYDNPVNEKALVDVAQLQARGCWWATHLLANNHLVQEILFSGSVEALNNIITIYVLEQMGVPSVLWENWPYVSPEARAAKRSEYFTYGAHWETDWWGFTATDTLLQLKEGFGWDFYRRVFSAYQNIQIREDDVQTWIQTTSVAAGVNLVPFYRVWNFPISPATITALSFLPNWAGNPFLRGS